MLRRLCRYLLRLISLSDYVDAHAANENIRQNVAFRGPNVIILFCAIVIASIGLNINSIPVIIGAMLVSPLMNPIIGFGLGLGTNDPDLVRNAVRNLFVMVFISVLASTLYFLISPLTMEDPSELIARTNPTIYDVLIALFGGFAGILEISRKDKGTVISGVAIATALMPPLCTAGYGIANWSLTYAVGALYLFFINCVFIALAAFVGTKYLGYPVLIEANPKQQRQRKIWFAIILTIMIVPSIISGYTIIVNNNFSRHVSQFVKVNKTLSRSYIYDYTLHNEQKPRTVELFFAGEVLSLQDSATLYQQAEQYGLQPRQIIIHQQAANHTAQPLADQKLFLDLLHENESKLQQSEQLTISLQQQIDSITSAQNLLYNEQDQVQREIQSQYPQVTDVVLSRTADSQVIINLVIANNKTLTENECERLQAWLSIRLNTTVKIFL